MNKKVLILSLLFSAIGFASSKSVHNDIPPRLEWNENSGYCGEVCLISAGLYYGQYVSQYDARAIACNDAPQPACQLLLGVNDQYAASKMHLKSIPWSEKNAPEFLAWVKKNVIKRYPVAIGVYTNEYRFYHNKNPNAGDPTYDHIVSVTGIESNDILFFSDNGLWGDPKHPPFLFHYHFKEFQADRRQANAKKGHIYSLPDRVPNHGIAITGVMDRDGDTLPVRLETNINYEKPEIENGSSVRPHPSPIILKIIVSGLKINTPYNLYRYNSFESVPDCDFNAHAKNAIQQWKIKVRSGKTYVMTQLINSDEKAIYRVVPADAP